MPPKRKSEVANEAGSNPEPVQKKRITAPKISPTSNLIVTAHSTLPPKDFVQLLKSSVLSKVESLSAEQLEEISVVLQTAIGEQRGRTEILDKIQYAAREKSIKGQLKDFQKSVRVNWKHCYDEQVSIILGQSRYFDS